MGRVQGRVGVGLEARVGDGVEVRVRVTGRARTRVSGLLVRVWRAEETGECVAAAGGACAAWG